MTGVCVLNIIGCGKVGRTLGWLWAQRGVFAIGDILNRSPESAQAARDFIGEGRALSGYGNLRPADVTMICTTDDAIGACCEQLAGSGVLRENDLVFHCSGALPSSHLKSVHPCGALLASIHPVKSFADPTQACQTFEGTFCGVEGDMPARETLCRAITQIGGKPFTIDANKKSIYHAANVIVCNYLTALLEFGTQAYSEAGISQKPALELMEPIVRETVDNIFKVGTAKALTGPIARGDRATVQKHVEALQTWSTNASELYSRLGVIALELARTQGNASPEALAALANVLKAKRS